VRAKEMKTYKIWFLVFFIFTFFCSGRACSALAAEAKTAEPKSQPERTNIYLRVVAVNPSKKEPKTVEVKNYLPPEVTPENVVNTGELELKYDEKKSLHYVYKKDINLAAGKIRIFTIELKDVWFIPEKELNSVKSQSQSLLSQIKGKEKEKTTEVITEINKRLEEIASSQEEAKAGPFKEQIVNYRNNQQALKEIKEDLKQLKELTKKAKKKIKD